MLRSEFITNLKAAATAVVAIGILGGGLVEGFYHSISKAIGLSVPGADVRGIITAVTALITVVGAGAAYMERQ